MCNAATIPTDGTRMLTTKIKESEYLVWSNLEKDTSSEQKCGLKKISTRFLTTQKRDND